MVAVQDKGADEMTSILHADAATGLLLLVFVLIIGILAMGWAWLIDWQKREEQD